MSELSPAVASVINNYSKSSGTSNNNQKIKNNNADLTGREKKIINTVDDQIAKRDMPVSNKKCPECKRNFSILMVNDIEVDACIYCSSLWFDSDELKSLTHLPKDVPSDGMSSRSSKYDCPICENLMREHVFLKKSNILVDKCLDNHGVYLESGELKRVFVEIKKDKSL